MQSLFQSFIRRRQYALFSFIAVLALSTSFPMRQPQAQTSPKPKIPQGELKRIEEYGFITVRTPTGSECRPMTEAEARALPAINNVELREIGGRELRSTQQGTLTIILQGTPQLDNFPQAKAAFQRAAAKWQDMIKTPITITVAVDFGATFFGAPYNNPNIIGQTNPVFLGLQDGVTFPNPYRFFRDSVLDLTTDAHTTAFYNALPTGGLPSDLGNIRNAGGTLVNLRGLEIADDDDLVDFGPPSIGFNSALPFDFDPSNGIDSDKLDFEATAVHEIGHALGFSSWTGLKELSPTNGVFPSVWDFFRFRNGPIDFTSVAARPRAFMAGGAQSYFIGDEFGLSTATPSGTNGDQRQASHWRDDLLSGHYIGIMDPTGANGDREVVTYADLTTLGFMGFMINPDARAFEIQSIADPSREETQERANAMVVNRYQPSRYPSQLEGIRILMPQGTEAGQSIRLIAFVDTNRTGQPPASPSLLINQTITVPSLPLTRYVEFRFATPPTINAGDVYIGMNVGASTVRIAADSTRPQGRSWLSTNDGASWSALPSINNAGSTANFMARAMFSSTYGTALAPQLASLSPDIVAPGAANATLFVTGKNFQRNSVIRFNGADRPTTYLSNTQLSMSLPPADIANAGTVPIRVFTPGGTESGTLTLTIGTNNPVPVITAIDPPSGQTGANGVTINVYGSNFNSASRVRFNDGERPTTLRSSTQLETTFTAADLANSATAGITVVNPAPGGGTSNLFGFPVSGCNFSFANAAGTGVAGFLVSSVANSNGFSLNVGNGACGWNLTSSESWLSITSPVSGTGRTVINFAVTDNAGATQRTAQIRVNNQQSITIQQAGRIASVSAASYANNQRLSANSIVSVFGQGMAAGPLAASTIPLPTRLGDTEATITFTQNNQTVTQNCSLFFVSATQINLLLPAVIPNGAARIAVRLNGSLFADQLVTIADVAPGLFAANADGQGVPAAQLLRVKPGGVLVYEEVAVFEGGRFVPRVLDVGPDADQLVLVLFGTGIRGVGALDRVQLRIADQTPPAVYAGPQPDYAGLDQINLNLTSIRASLRGRGEVNLTGTIGGQTVNTLTLRFQ